MLDDDIVIPDSSQTEEDDWESYNNITPSTKEEKAWICNTNPIPKQPDRKNWTNVNNCKYDITALNIVKLIWSNNMKKRWCKKYTKTFPTYHAIGKKWQGILDSFVKDLQLAVSNYKMCGNFPHETWAGNIVQITDKQYRLVKQKYPKHVEQIVRSLLEDREVLDSNKNIFGNL